MTRAREWIPGEMPLDKPSAARVYDYLLGGYHNFESDRLVAEKLLKVYPDLGLAAQVNRAFLRRAIHFLLVQGKDQFLDIGSGIPTVGNVHEIAQSVNPAARVVYVDIDPIAVAHGKAMLKGNSLAIAIRGDVREPEQILDHDDVKTMLDLNRPTALLLVSVLHYVLEDEKAYNAVRFLRDALAPGSYIVIAHTIPETQPAEVEERLHQTFRSASTTRNRTRDQIVRFFDGLELIEPGLVYTPLWRPEGPDDVLLDRPERGLTMAGVAHKP